MDSVTIIVQVCFILHQPPHLSAQPPWNICLFYIPPSYKYTVDLKAWEAADIKYFAELCPTYKIPTKILENIYISTKY